MTFGLRTGEGSRNRTDLSRRWREIEEAVTGERCTHMSPRGQKARTQPSNVMHWNFIPVLCDAEVSAPRFRAGMSRHSSAAAEVDNVCLS